MPLLLIVAGSNGAGKTTFAKPYVAKRGLRFLNADELTRELELAGEEAAQVKAGRMFLEQLSQAIAAGESLAIETSLSGFQCLHSIKQRNMTQILKTKKEASPAASLELETMQLAAKAAHYENLAYGIPVFFMRDGQLTFRYADGRETTEWPTEILGPDPRQK